MSVRSPDSFGRHPNASRVSFDRYYDAYEALMREDPVGHAMDLVPVTLLPFFSKEISPSGPAHRTWPWRPSDRLYRNLR